MVYVDYWRRQAAADGRMKNEWCYSSSWQYSSGDHPRSDDGARTDSTQLRSDMGLAPQRDTMVTAAFPETVSPSDSVLVTVSRVTGEGGQCVQCTCPCLSGQTDILHGILTGQGHKYGYSTTLYTSQHCHTQTPGNHQDICHSQPGNDLDLCVSVQPLSHGISQ